MRGVWNKCIKTAADNFDNVWQTDCIHQGYLELANVLFLKVGKEDIAELTEYTQTQVIY